MGNSTFLQRASAVKTQQRIMKGRKRARKMVSQKVSRQRIQNKQTNKKEWVMALTTMKKSSRTKAKKLQNWTSGGHWEVETASNGGFFWWLGTKIYGMRQWLPFKCLELLWSENGSKYKTRT